MFERQLDSFIARLGNRLFNTQLDRCVSGVFGFQTPLPPARLFVGEKSCAAGLIGNGQRVDRDEGAVAEIDVRLLARERERTLADDRAVNDERCFPDGISVGPGNWIFACR